MPHRTRAPRSKSTYQFSTVQPFVWCCHHHHTTLTGRQVAEIRDPWRELQEITCRVEPGPRTLFGAAQFQQAMVVMGGRGSGPDTLWQDAWVRDDRTPTAFIQDAPSVSRQLLCH